MIKIMKINENPLTQIGEIAGVCYNTTNPKYFKRIAEQVLNEGHWRVAEFPEVIFEYDGYSAKVLREWYTHFFMSRLQASTRYIDYTQQFDYSIPPSVQNNIEALELWEKHMFDVSNTMEKLKALGIPTEDFSNVLPLAYHTKGVVKVGLRELINIFNVRACTCVYHEMRKMVKDIKDAIKATGNEEWIWLADNFFVPKCDLKLFCEEEKRWSSCKRHPKKSQVKKLIEDYKSEGYWREVVVQL